MIGEMRSRWRDCTELVSSPVFGYLTRSTKHSVTLFAHDMPRARTFGEIASASRRSCCDTTFGFEGKPWSTRHRHGSQPAVHHPAQQIAFQTYLNALEHDEARKSRSRRRSAIFSRARLGRSRCEPCRRLKAWDRLSPPTIIAEVGDFSRFAHPRQLVAYFGLAPGEHSSGGTAAHAASPRRAAPSPHRAVRGGLELPDHAEGRAVDERAVPARAARHHGVGLEGPVRLHKTYRRLTARGKRSVVATAAVARELLGFIWSIGQRVPLGA